MCRAEADAAEFYAGKAAVSNALRAKLGYRVLSYDIEYNRHMDPGIKVGFSQVA